MARPTKKGLDFFPFDVGFFDGGIMVTASKHFGIKGEITAVKLLCAVYRNGYFALWDDDSRDKLLGSLPGISGGLLDQIVSSLVRWGLFDKGLFESEHVLTSMEIQKKYFFATKRRGWLKGQVLPYLLCDPQELMSTKTKLMSTKTKFLHAKVHKEKNINKLIFPIIQENTHTNAREAISEIRENASLTDGYCMTYHLSREELSRYLDEFGNYAELSMKTYDGISDAANHFQLWLIRKLKEKKQHGNTDKRTSADYIEESKRRGIEEAMRFIREAEAARR